MTTPGSALPSTRRPIAGPPEQGSHEPGGDGDPKMAPDWFWVDFDAVRAAFLAAGFVEHAHVTKATVCLMVRPAPSGAGADDDTIEVLVPLAPYFGYVPAVRNAIEVLETITGRSAATLAVLTEREAELWRTIQSTRTVIAAAACGAEHAEDLDGTIHHTYPDGRADLFAHGRCEMRDRISARLEHVLAGGD